MEDRRIAFIKSGAYSHTNDRVREVLEERFADYRVETIDIREMTSAKHPANLLHVMREHGGRILDGREDLRSAMLRTTYMFRAIRQAAARRFDPSRYALTFQTQSLFDASVPGIPHMVYTDHTHLANLGYPGWDRRQLMSPTWIGLERSIYHNATLNLTMSTHITRSLVEDYGCPPEKVVCVWGGSNVDAAQVDMTDTKFARRNVLFVGLDWARKGGPELVAAFRRVRGVYPDATLTIVGARPEVDQAGCEVVGPVPLEDVAAYYARASVFCLPTWREPAGMVFIEAMTHRLPIVATNIGPLPDYVTPGENGCLVAPGDVEGLADALIDLLGDPVKCRAFADQSRARATQTFTWEGVGHRIREQADRVLLDRRL